MDRTNLKQNPDLKQSFVLFESFIKDPTNQSKIPIKVKQKLEVLQSQLNCPDEQIDPKQFDQLQEDELKQLTILPMEAKIQLYLNILSCFIRIFTGQVHIMGSIFWNLKDIELDQDKKLLKISRKNKKKDWHNLDLTNYSIKWTDFKKDKYTFQLNQSQSVKSKFKELLIGCDCQNEAEQWFNNFKKCFQKGSESVIQSTTNIRQNTIRVVSTIAAEEKIESSQQKKEDQTSKIQLVKPFENEKEKMNYAYLNEEIQFQLIDYTTKIRIVKSKELPVRIKGFLKLPPSSGKQIIVALYDGNMRSKWNEKKESISVVPSHNLLILEDDITKRSFFYKKKSSTIMRSYYYEKKSEIYILERYDSFDAILGIFRKQLLICEISNVKGSIQVAIDYLKRLSHLPKFLKELKVRLEFEPMHMPQYLSLIEVATPVNHFNQRRVSSIIKIEEESKVVQALETPIKPELMSVENQLADILNCRHYYRQLHQYSFEFKDQQAQQNIQTSEGLHFFYKDEWVIDEKKGVLKFIHKKKLDLQKDVFKFILKKIGSNLLAGKSVLNISLPVYIFDRKSNLERFAYSFTYAPILEVAAATDDPVKQMQQAFLFGVGEAICYLNLEKPFNPILGETYQGWIKGCPIFLEQISHHPPIAAFYFQGRGFNFFGNFESQAQMGPNTVVGKNEGFVTINFVQTKNSIQLISPAGVISGITLGDRIFYIDGPMFLVDVVNQLVGHVNFNPSTGFFGKKKTLDYFEGGIYRVDEREIQRFKLLGIRKYDGLPLGHNFQKMSDLSGRWYQYVNADGKEIFNIQKDFPYVLEHEEIPLASDGRYREDLVAWKSDNFDLAMEKKEKLENIQREDRKLRAKLGPKKKGH